MEIYILRDGQETGPFTEDSMHKMLKDGSVTMSDLAWQPGMEGWTPVQSVLFPSADRAEANAAWNTPAVAVEQAPVSEPATPKQRAFLAYMGILCPDEATKEQAAVMVNDAMEEPKNATKVARWNEDRLKLHPELFAAELLAKKEARIQNYFDRCQTEGSDAVEGVTKAHCQVLVGYLDVKVPNWDSNPHDALWNFFLPAIAEKFPQLVRPEWKGKLKYAGPKVAPELKRKTAAVRSPVRKQSSPIASLAKGLFYGLMIVAIVGGTLYLQNNPAKRDALFEKAGLDKLLKPSPRQTAGTPTTTEQTTKAPTAPPAVPIAAMGTDAGIAAAKTPAEVPATPAPAASESSSALFAPAAPAPAAAAAAPAPVNPAPVAQESSTMSAAPAAPANPAPAPAAAPATASSSMSLFDPNPNATSPAAAQPAPAPANTSLFDPNPAKPAAPAAQGSPAAAAAADASPIPAQRTTVTLTQTIEVQIPFGKVKIPAGSHLKVVEQDGTNLKVQFQNRTVSVPVNVTDLTEQAPPSAQ